MKLIHEGRRSGIHLQWLMYQVSLGDDTMPSSRYLRWNTRTYTQEQYDHYWSEQRPGMMPGVEVSLMRYTITPFLGEMYILYRVTATISLRLGERPGCNFEVTEATRSRELALAAFRRYKELVRCQLIATKGGGDDEDQ